MATTVYDIEDLYRHLGVFGNFQIFVVVMYTIGERVTAGLLDFQVHILAVIPNWTCLSDYCFDVTRNQTFFNKSELCEMNRDEWEWDESRSNLVTEFDLICKDTYKVSLGSTLFFTGYPIGSLLIGFVSDYVGRKWLATTFLVLTGLMNCIAAMLPNYTSFIVLRAMEGFCIGGLTVTFYPLIIEYIGSEARNLANMVAQCGYGLGMAFLCFTASYIDSWRAVVISTSAHLFFVALIVATNIPESPRYLLKYKDTEAKQVLKIMASWNKVKLPDEFEICQPKENSCPHERAWSLFTYSRYTCLATLSQLFIWFTAALYFFALSFNMNDVMGNPYVNLAATGVMEILINMSSYFVIDRIGRRWCLLFSFVCCGISVGICRFLPHSNLHYTHFSVKTFMVIVGRAVAGFIYSLVYLYSAEIFPTTVRSSGLGLCVFVAQVSSLIAPFVIVIHDDNANIIYTVLFLFCIMAFLAGWNLPETANCPLPRTIAEMDAMKYRSYNIFNEKSPLIVNDQHEAPN